MKKQLYQLFIIIMWLPLLATAATTDTIPSRDNNAGMGNPSNATTAIGNMNNYLVVKPQFTLSYNNSKGMANWVSWHLSTAWKGSATRCDCFTQDATLPSGYYRASTANYTATGFDRGHICPSDDRDGSDTDNAATFKMTNISPQAPILNQQTWGDLEDYCRTLANQGKELYIIAGGYGTGGSGSNGGTTTSIDGSNINVPSHFWKVIIVLPVGINDVSRVTESTQVIAVDMPNNQSVNSHHWEYYRTSIDNIEALTGYDFLSNVDTTIQHVIEARVDSTPTTLITWNSYGSNNAATLAPANVTDNLDTLAGLGALSRGPTAAASTGANSFRTTGFQNNGIATTNNDYFQVKLKAKAGYTLSLTGIDARYAGTTSFCASPGVNAQFAYSLDGTAFTLIGSPFTTIGTPAVMSTINTSGISALQNVGAATTIYIRYFASGQTNSGSWGFYSPSATDNALSIAGSLTPTGCLGAPTAGAAYASANSICMGSNSDISLPTGTTGTGISYQWQSSTTGTTGSFTLIAGATNMAYTATPAMGTTYYRSIVTCNNTVLSDTSTAVAVTTNVTNAGTISGSSSVVAGAYTTLSASVAGGTWSSSTTTIATVDSTGTVSGIAPGTTTISYTVTDICGTATVTTNITVLTGAGVITGGNRAVCLTEGGLLLTDPIAGGLWSSSNTSVATVNSTGTVTAISVGVVTITYTAGGSYATTSVTINGLPAAGTITGSTVVNTGTSITLSNLTSGGVWSSSNVIKASIGSTGIVTGINAGSVVISYSVLNSCGSATAVRQVEVISSSSCVSIISTIAGNGSNTIDNVAATASILSQPRGVAIDGGGNIYIADYQNHRVRKISNTGVITTFAGTGTAGFSGNGGPATAAQLVYPIDVKVDLAGNVYIVSNQGTAIRKVDTNGIITLFAGSSTGYNGDGGAATAAALGSPQYIATDLNGNIYISDYLNHRIRKINSSGTISTIAGNGTNGTSGDGGPATAAALNFPNGIAIDNSNNIYFSSGNRVRKVDGSGIITTIAGSDGGGYSGDGAAATAAILNNPIGLAVDNSGNVFISDYSNNRVRKINSSGIISTIAGNGGTFYTGDGIPATAAPLIHPREVAIDGSGNLFIADEGSNRIRKVGISGIITTVAGGGPVGDGGIANSATINYPYGIARDRIGNIYFADLLNYRVRKVDTAGLISTIAGNGTAGYSGDGGTGNSAAISRPFGVTVDLDGNVYICDADNSCVRKVSTTGIITTFVTGVSPRGIAVDKNRNIYLAEGTSQVRKISTAGVISTIAGNGTSGYSGDGGAATDANLTSINSVAVDGNNNLYLLDIGNSHIRKIDSSGIITTIGWNGMSGANGDGGPATSASFNNPFNIATDGTGNLYVADLGNGRIRKINASGIITTVAGSGFGTPDDGGPATLGHLANPSGVAADSAGNLYISDQMHNRVRYVNSCPIIASAITGTLNICAGATTTLSNAVSGGVWSSSDLSIATVDAYSGVVNGIASGTSEIRYTVSGNTATAIVTINPLPDAGAIIAPYQICEGLTGTLSATIVSGTWSSSTPSVATINSSGQITAIAAGTTNISYTVTNSCGVAVATKTITINPLPTAGAIAGVSTVNTGATITLSATQTGGIWTTSNSRATVSDSGVVAGVGAGTVTISYSITNGCGTAVATKTVTVTIAATPVTGILAVCAGGTTTLSNLTSDGVWSSGAPGIAAVVSGTGVVTGNAAGTATISYTVSGTTITAVVTVNPLPAAINGTAIACENAVTSLNDASAGGTWSIDNTTVATISSTGSVTGIASGVTVVSYTLGTGCLRTLTITVNAVPPPITGTQSGCVGNITTLANTMSGGTWSSNYTSIISVGATSGIITSLTAGTAVVTYTLPTGCKTSTGFAVNATPGPISGVTKACIGTTTTLGSATTGGSWLTLNTDVATIDAATGVVTGLAAGTALITYTSGTGCIRTTIVTINPLPAAITGPTTVCSGRTITLSDTTAGGLSWTSSNGAVATVNSLSGVVTGISAGTATVTYTLNTGCIATTTITVTSIPAAITGTLKTCVGATTSLANAMSGGIWSSSNVTVGAVNAGGVVTGIANGTTTISYTVGGGCTTTTVVTVNLSPAISGTLAACTGTTTTLSGTGGSGTWTSSNTAVGTVTAVTGQVNALTPGTTTISYTLSTGCSANIVVTVTSTITTSSGPSAICMGSTGTLSNTTTGGTWASGNPGIATVGTSNGVVTTLYSTGTVNITYVLGASGCKTVKTITINPVPTAITGTMNVCTGTATTLSSSTGGTWSSNNIAVGTIGSISVVSGRFAALSAGTATVSYTLTNGCAKSAIMTVNATPNAGTITSSGGFVINTATPPTSATLSSTGDPAGTWTSNNTAVATVGAGTGVVNSTGAGVANISYTLTLGSCSARATHTVNVVAARSVTDAATAFAKDDVSIYPNPNNGGFVIKGTIATELNGPAAITITDMAGQIVYSNKIAVADGTISETIQLNKTLTDGMYLLTLYAGNETKVFHFVIQQ